MKVTVKSNIKIVALMKMGVTLFVVVELIRVPVSLPKLSQWDK